MKILFSLIFLISCSWAKERELQTVDYVDVSRYVGKWYAVSALPQFFTRSCTAQTAEYSVINPQTISVLNTCLKKKGSTVIRGEATVSNAATNAELDVRFDNFFTRLFRVVGDYNIVKLDRNYRYVLVGSRDRKSLWILSRTESMPKADYEDYIKAARDQGFPVEKLELSKF